MKISKYISFLLIFSFIIFGSLNAQKTRKAKLSKSKNEENRVKAERIFFSGLKEKVKENYTEAVNYFTKAVKYYPIDAAYYEIALIKYSQKDYAIARKNIESALNIENTNKWYRELYAELLSIDKKYDKSAVIYKQLREENPSNIDYYYSEAYFYIKQNKLKDAIKVYNILEARNGIQEDIINEKYSLYMKTGKDKEAEKELIKLTEAYPKNLLYLNKLASFYLAKNENEKAVNIFEKILEENPNEAKTIMSLADYYNHIGNKIKYKEYSEKAFLSTSIKIDTKISILYDYIRIAENDKTVLKEALNYAKLLAKTNPEDAKTWAIYGDIYNIDEQPKKALEKYLKSLEIKQNIFSVWQQVFFIESDLNEYQNLISHTEEAKELFPNQAMVYFFNGLAYQQTNNYEKATKSYKKGVKMAVRNSTLKAQFYSNLGESYNSLKEYTDSDKYFELSLELEPNNQYTLNNYAYYLSLRNENLERAKEMSLKSLELSVDNPTYLDTYAWILYKDKDYKQALEFQKKAIELSENLSEALYEHLGDILFKLNKTNEAVNAWQKAKDKGNDTKELEKKIKDRKL